MKGLILVAAILTATVIGQGTSSSDPTSTQCSDFTCVGGSQQVGVSGKMDASPPAGVSHPAVSTPRPRVVASDCGSPLGGIPGVNAACVQALSGCKPTAPTVIPIYLHVIVTVTYPINGTAPLTQVNCFADTRGQRPVLTTAAIAQEIRRLLPRTPIRTPQPVSLVNFKVLLWLNTPAVRALGPVTLLGRRVQIRIILANVHWNFGDQQSDTTHDPGTPYDPAHDCGACPDAFGHTFVVAGGPRTMTATVDWQAKFNVDNSGWTTLPTPVTGPAATSTILLREARGVLIADTGR